MVYLTRREHFNAAHKLAVPSWTEEENQQAFGVCANPNYHGHNFVLYVTIKGEPNATTGLLMDVKDLSQIIREHVIQKLDHKNLNLDVDFLQGKNPTTENLAIGIWQQLAPALDEQIHLHVIRLFETENHYVEYFGD